MPDGGRFSLPFPGPFVGRGSGLVACGLAVVLLCGAIGDAMAQEAVRDSVQARPRPEYDPIGFELDRLFTDTVAAIAGHGPTDPEASRGVLSSFVVMPKLELDVTQTDNLFRTDTNRRSDTIFALRPTLRVASDWDNHSLAFVAEGDFGRHRRTASEDYDDYKFETTGRINVDEFDSVDAQASFEHSHEQRGGLDDPGLGFGPTLKDIYKVNARYEHKVPDGILFRPYAGITRYRYENNGSIDNSDRWRDDFEYRLRLGYEFEPGTTIFVQPRYTSLDYRRRFDRNGLIRDTQLLEGLVGVTWDASAVTFLEASIGFLSASFDDPSFGGETNPTANLQLTWNATPLLTLKSEITRSFSPTATAGLAGTLDTTVENSLDWEARYNLILGIAHRYRLEDFIDARPAHTRATNRFELNARWLVNEYFFARGELSRETRSGDVPADDLEEDRLTMTLGAQL